MNTTSRIRCMIVMASMLILSAVTHGQENLLKGTNFGEGLSGWGGVASDDKKGVAVVDLPEGKKGLQLTRKAEGSVGIDQTVTLKPMTVYRLSVTGFGKAHAGMRLRPASSKDAEYAKVFKAWVITTSPLPVCEKPQTTEVLFDSGLKADSAIAMVYLAEPKELESYTITAVSLTEVGSSKAADDETIILHLGDSFSAGVYLSTPERLQTKLQDKLIKELPGRKFRQINLAADGEYIKELLTSTGYRRVVRENYPRIDIAIIRYGGNDSRFGTAEDFKKQMATLCDNLVKDYPNIKIVLSNGIYVKGWDDVNKQYAAFWQVPRDLAKERSLPLIDIYARFEKEQSDKLTIAPDNMHPSAAGVAVMADEECAVLKTLLTTPTSSPTPAKAATIAP